MFLSVTRVTEAELQVLKITIKIIWYLPLWFVIIYLDNKNYINFRLSFKSNNSLVRIVVLQEHIGGEKTISKSKNLNVV